MTLDLKITETAIPETTREEKPNPFSAHFPTKPAVLNDDGSVKTPGKAIEVTMPYGTEDERKAVASTVTLAQKAGRACDTTTRVKRTEFSEKSKQYITLTMWSVPAIKRPRTGSETAE